MFSCMYVMSFDQTPCPITLSCLPLVPVEFFLPAGSLSVPFWCCPSESSLGYRRMRKFLVATQPKKMSLHF